MDNTNITDAIREREVSLKELKSFMDSSKETLKQIVQYYGGTTSFLEEEKRLFGERAKNLQEELELLKQYGRSTYLKEIEIEEKNIAEETSRHVGEKISAAMSEIKKLQDFKGDLKIENGKYEDAYKTVFNDNGETLQKILKTIKDAGLNTDLVEKELEKSSEETRSKVAILYVAALRKMSLEGEEVQLKNFKNTQKYLTSTYDLSKGLATNIMKINDYSNSLAMNLLTVQNSITPMVRGFKDMLNPLNLALNIAMKIATITKDMIFSFDRMNAMYSKEGGLIEMDKDMLMGAGQELQLEGISEEMAGRAGAALHSFYSDFSMLDEEMRKNLTKTGARMEAVGISASTYASMLNSITNTLGKSAGEANSMILDLEQSSREMGISGKKMGEEFKSAFSVLSMYGTKAMNVMKGLYREAKKTGLELSTLVALEEKFTTFDNAAEFAGKMAAITGRNVIDPIKLMMATDENKVGMVRDALQAANIKDPRGIMYMAKGLGLSNDQVQMLMDQNSEKQKPEVAAGGFQEIVQLSITFAEKFKNVLKSLAVAVGPLLQLITWLVQALQWFLTIGDGIPGKIVVWGTALYMLTGLVARLAFNMLWGAKAAAINTAAQVVATDAAIAQAAAQRAAAASTVGFSSAMTALASGAAGMLAFGAMLLLIAAGIWVLSQALRGFAAAAASATLEQWASLALGLVLLSGAFVVFAAAMSLALPLVFLAGPAIFVLGGLLTVLALTIPGVAPLLSLFAEGLTELGIAFVGFTFRMIKAGAAMFFSFGAFGKGLSSFKSAVSGLAGALKDINLDAVSSFNTMIITLMNLSNKASAFSLIAAGIRDISSALIELNALEALGLTAKLSTIQDFTVNAGRGVVDTVGAVASLNGEKIANFEKLVNVSERLVNVTKNSDTEQLTNLINSTKEVINSSMKSAMGGDLTVKVMIDEREIGRTVVKYAREEVLGASNLK